MVNVENILYVKKEICGNKEVKWYDESKVIRHVYQIQQYCNRNVEQKKSK